MGSFLIRTADLSISFRKVCELCGNGNMVKVECLRSVFAGSVCGACLRGVFARRV